MKSVVPEKLNRGRVREGFMGSDDTFGMAGAFRVMGPLNTWLRIVSSGENSSDGWEHVSVSIVNRIPTWMEMCFIKDLFWDKEECVIQYHPPKSMYVNTHPNCLHLWKEVGKEFVMPPSGLVG